MTGERRPGQTRGRVKPSLIDRVVVRPSKNDRSFEIELDGLPAEARKVIAAGLAKLDQLLKANVAFAKPKIDVDSLCDLISAFFSGICVEANLNPDRKRARRKIGVFMQMLKAA